MFYLLPDVCAHVGLWSQEPYRTRPHIRIDESRSPQTPTENSSACQLLLHAIGDCYQRPDTSCHHRMCWTVQWLLGGSWAVNKKRASWSQAAALILRPCFKLPMNPPEECPEDWGQIFIIVPVLPLLRGPVCKTALASKRNKGCLSNQVQAAARLASSEQSRINQE